MSLSLRKLNCTIALFLVLQLIVPTSILAAAAGQFTAVVGQVTQTTDGKAIKPAAKSPIQIKDLIVTGPSSRAAMVFNDESTITLDQNSNFEVRDFTVKDNARTGSFFLAMGKLTADVKKFIGGSNVFEVRTPTATAGVRGTGFEIVVAMVAGQMTTTVTCTAGLLSISALSVAGTVVSTTSLVAGQAAVITSTGITVSAAGVAAGAAAAEAGATAGTGTVAGVTAGTVAAGTVAAAAAIGIAASSTGSETPAAHHTTPTHHTAPTHH